MSKQPRFTLLQVLGLVFLLGLALGVAAKFLL